MQLCIELLNPINDVLHTHPVLPCLRPRNTCRLAVHSDMHKASVHEHRLYTHVAMLNCAQTRPPY